MNQPDQLTQLAAQIITEFKQRQITIASAESCTGGLIGDVLTNIAGASDVYIGGIIAYSNAIKQQFLGVSNATLEQYGAVSSQTAIAMAEGAQQRLGSTIAIATTGIAGPGGGSAEKPVGLVYLGLATPTGIFTERHIWPSDRIGNKQATVQRALEWLYEWLQEQS